MVGSITPSITVNASLSPLDASPTLPSLCKISNGTLTLKCSGLEDTFTFAGGQGTKILINTNTKTISFISALVNDTSPQSITCPLNAFVNAYNNVTRTFSCTTVSGAGILQLNGDSQANQFINSGNTNHIVVLDSGNTHSIDIAFKINNASCAAGYFITSFNNATGNYSCATPTSSGITHLNGDGSTNQTIGAGQGITVVDAGSVHTVKINFKVNNISCPANYFISSFSNSTGVYSCSVVPVTSAILTLDGDSSPSQSLQGTANHIKITDLGNIHTFDIGFKVNNVTCSAGFFLTSFNNVTGAYSCSSGNSGTITGIVNIGHGGKGFSAGVSGTNVQIKNLTSTRNDLFTINENATDVTLSSSFKSNTLSCSAGNAIVSFNNSTGSYTCSPFALTDTNTAQITNAGNGVGLFANRTNATQNTIKTLRCSNGVSCASNSTDVQITSTVTGTITGITNIGHGGKGVGAGVSGTNVQIKNLTSIRTDLFTVGANATDVTLSSSFKSDSITCSNQFISAFNNATGIYTCASTINTAQVVDADSGTSLISSKFNATETKMKTLGNVTNYLNWTHNSTRITPTFQFKINTLSCPANSAFISYSNTTGLLTCQAFGNVTSINDLGDVVISGASNGQILQYTSPNWKNINFKANTLSCPANQYFISFNNSTGTLSCSTVVLSSLTNAGHVSTAPTTTGTLCQINQTSTCGASPSGSAVILAANVTSTSTTNFAHVWNIGLTANSGNAVDGVLVVTSNTAGGAVQVGANMSSIATGSGLCDFNYASAGTTLTTFAAALGTTSSDSAWTTILAGANQAYPIEFHCAIVTGSSPPTLQINFQAEVASTVAVKAGSFYTKTP